MMYAPADAEGCVYQIKGNEGYYSHQKAYKDPQGFLLHSQGYTWDVVRKCWVPPAGAAGTVPGGRGFGQLTPGAETAGGGYGNMVLPIAGAAAVVALVFFAMRRRK